MGVRWSIHEVDGEYEVYQGTRRKRTWPHYGTALKWLGTKFSPGDKVYLVEPDGYRIDITRKHFLR